jgi:hypothetical protein
MEVLMLINGLLFCYLLFTGKLSDRRAGQGEHSSYLGLSLFLALLIIMVVAYFLRGFQLIGFLSWGAALAAFAALLIRVVQLWGKARL